MKLQISKKRDVAALNSQLEDLKKFFFDEYGLVLSDKELLECYYSLYYIAKSIVAYVKLKEVEEVNE